MSQIIKYKRYDYRDEESLYRLFRARYPAEWGDKAPDGSTATVGFYNTMFVVCHDDIVTSRGPVCSPEWMNKYIFPCYEEQWAIVKEAGKQVIFMADGCMDAFADDVMACGASGIISEPMTDYMALSAGGCYITSPSQEIQTDVPYENVKALIDTAMRYAKASPRILTSL